MGVAKTNSDSMQPGGVEKRLRAERHEIIQALVAESLGDGELREGWQERGSPVEDEMRELAFSHRDALRRRLRETDEAIGRLKAGTYGTCALCGKTINQKRLAADPAVSLCVSCQSASEDQTPIPKM
jgi:RNA polymerase-binding transcription factor DksA